MAATGAALGSIGFLAAAGVAAAAYAAMLWRVWDDPGAPRALLLLAFAFAAAFRVPPALAEVGPDSDMVRYLWDGRLQVHGYSPYDHLPSHPGLAHLHTEETAAMPSLRHRTPYPPAAQLFFRMVVGIADSTRGMKIALIACDLLTLLVLWRWLAITGRNEWLSLAYAWNPLVVLEISHSGHIDAVAMLWVAATAYWLAQHRTTLASLAFVLGIATKLLPVVLAPLFFRRIQFRDALLGAAIFALLYLPFMEGPRLPVGAVPNVIDHIRFNGPVFAALAWLASPRAAAGLAVVAGIATALWARYRLSRNDPAAWAWPMAVALLAAPVIYPWYLLPLTPFLFSRTTLPLTVWTLSAIPVYVVWRISRNGGVWVAPWPLLVVEFGLFLAACWAVFRREPRPAPAREPA